MRALFTFVGGAGHLEPMAPVARAAAAAGHDVAFACAPGMCAAAEAAGFRAFALGAAPRAAPTRLPLRPVDREREDHELRERFVRRAARARVPLVRALCEEWRPDVVVTDETDFGARIAAERLGLPFATVLVVAAGSFVRREVVAEALDELRAEHGLGADPELAQAARYLVLSSFPASLRDPAFPLPATAQGVRPPDAEGARVVAPLRKHRPAAPLVYFTLGTVFNVESGDLLHRVVSSLRELELNLVATVGPHVDPAELGPQPDHVRVERYVPQRRLLPHCDLVVSHGGSGSVLGALAHGLPQVLLPLGADQPHNAERCAALGVAEVLDAARVGPEALRDSVRRVLEEPSYRRRAELLRDEIAALPPPAAAVPLLERLALGRRPLAGRA